MGAVPSRHLATKILDISEAAVRDGHSAIQVDENLAKELLSFWKAIPQSMRDIITGRKRSQKENQDTTKDPAPYQTQEDRQVDSNQEPVPTTAEEEATKLLQTDLCLNHWERFSGTCQEIMKARVSNTIRERFVKVTMGKVLQTYKKQKDIEEDAATLFFPQMSQDAKNWAAEGRKLESLCQGLYSSIYSKDAIEEQHLGLLYVLPLDMPKEIVRTLSFKDGEKRHRCINSLKTTLMAKGIGGEQLKIYTAMAVSLFNKFRADLDPGTMKLSSHKYVFTQASLPSEGHPEHDCAETTQFEIEAHHGFQGTTEPLSSRQQQYETHGTQEMITSQLHLNNQEYEGSSNAQANGHLPGGDGTQSVRSMSRLQMPSSPHGSVSLRDSHVCHNGNRSICGTPRVPDARQESQQGYASMANFVDIRASEGGILCPLPEIDGNGRISPGLSPPPGSSSFHVTSVAARSGISDSPESRDQVSALSQGNTSISNQLTEMDSASGYLPEASSMSLQFHECSQVSEQRKRKRSHIEESGRQNGPQLLQETPRFLDTSGREQDRPFSDEVLQIEHTDTDLLQPIEEGSQITNSKSSAFCLDGESQLNSAEWSQPSFNISDSSLSESASRLPVLESITSDQTNFQAGNELYTLFDQRTLDALPNPLLWSLFSPENQPSGTRFLDPM